jgi:hypothetical protein
MAIKNMKELLTAGTKLPAAIEEKLPTGAPKISTMLADAASKIPEGPGFPIELPDLPAPKLPDIGGGLPALGREYVKEVEVTPTGAKVTQKKLGEEILS